MEEATTNDDFEKHREFAGWQKWQNGFVVGLPVAGVDAFKLDTLRMTSWPNSWLKKKGEIDFLSLSYLSP